MSGGDEKIMKQFLAAGADNVVLKPAKTDMLVDILLTGLEMVVVFDETQRCKPTAFSVPSVNREKDSDIETVRKEHMDHLLKFLTETKAKAQAVLVPIPVPILVPVIVPDMVPVLPLSP